MMKLLVIFILPALCLLFEPGMTHAADIPIQKKPNIVFILADDLGYQTPSASK